MIRYFGRYSLWVWFFLLLPAAHVAAGEGFAPRAPAQYGEFPKHADRAKGQYEADRARYKDATDVLVLPGLVARRKQKRIEIIAESTGLDEEAIVEFLLIDRNSDKGYESLLWSFAKPSDVHKALVFIGMKPGRPFNPAKLRFWPKGERVLATVAAAVGADDSDEKSPAVRLESLVLDKNTGEPLPEAGFVFTGSFITNGFGDQSKRVYAADLYEPKSVASLYNDPIAVLDVPRRAEKSRVYGTQVVGPQFDFPKNQLVTIVLEPEHKDGRRRVKDMVLQVRRSAEKAPGGGRADAAETSPAIDYVLTDATGKTISDKSDLPTVLGVFAELINKGHDPYVSVRFASALALADVRKVCRVLAAIDSESGIRVEPPAAGQLYYQALLPDKGLLDPENRLVDPWELRLAGSNGELSGTLTLRESAWVAGAAPKRRVSTFEVDTAQSLREQLDADAARRRQAGRRPAPPVLLVFAEGNLAYGRLMDFLAAALTTHNIVHVFLDPL